MPFAGVIIAIIFLLLVAWAARAVGIDPVTVLVIGGLLIALVIVAGHFR